MSRGAVGWGEADREGPDAVVNTTGHVEHKPLVDLVFVCPGFRRQGIASALVQAMAEDRGASPGELLAPDDDGRGPLPLLPRRLLYGLDIGKLPNRCRLEHIAPPRLKLRLTRYC